MTEERRLLLIEQLRPPVGALSIELPAGVIEKQETPRAAAIRELQEETGYRARSDKPLFAGSTSPGVTDDQNTICLARELRRIDESHRDREFPDGTRKHHQIRGAKGESESLFVWEVPIRGVHAWLKRKRTGGYVIDMRVCAGLHLLEHHSEWSLSS